MFFLRLIRLLVYSNIFIACCAVGLQWFVQPETSIIAAAFLFSSVIVMYSALKLLGLKNHARQSESSAIAWLQRNTALQFGITLIAFICAMLCWKQLGFPFYCKLANSIGIAFVVYLLSNSAYDVFISKIISSLHENYCGCCCLGACAFTCKCRNFIHISFSMAFPFRLGLNDSV
jgi:peptidoglycan/LPS O-acetylase OafA/YrhL